MYLAVAIHFLFRVHSFPSIPFLCLVKHYGRKHINSSLIHQKLRESFQGSSILFPYTTVRGTPTPAVTAVRETFVQEPVRQNMFTRSTAQTQATAKPLTCRESYSSEVVTHVIKYHFSNGNALPTESRARLRKHTKEEISWFRSKVHLSNCSSVVVLRCRTFLRKQWNQANLKIFSPVLELSYSVGFGEPTYVFNPLLNSHNVCMLVATSYNSLHKVISHYVIKIFFTFNTVISGFHYVFFCQNVFPV